jgi:hypothetical protein
VSVITACTFSDNVMDLGDFHGSLTVLQQLTKKMARKYCIMDGNQLALYDTQEQAMKMRVRGYGKDASVHVVGTGTWDGAGVNTRLTKYPNTFSIRLKHGEQVIHECVQAYC